ncbi:MAG: FKBP-type peptidyl-prolyl cis-trans isomerase [Tannerella sp.]|jgi:FKBP-type peptidyl-prolyl cis-trans isomerase FkpA/FKBP-type peptidyl-prolyl cis-trans isomerase FklB|nr:FKBP-type peptidyl-prolyl cis-trans isomerase [Tannerella sp.]
MNKLITFIVLALFLGSCGAKKVAQQSTTATVYGTAMDSVSFLVGSSFGKGLATQMTTFPGGPGNVDALIDGFSKAAKGDSLFLGMTETESRTYVDSYFQSATMREAEATLEKGRKFLEENKGKAGVVTTESGLQYKVITEGTGEKPTLEDTVAVHYTGKLLDGTVFDSSVERGESARFPLNVVIPGWGEGVQLMSKGSKYILWIPSELAYGSQSTNPQIKPNSVLEFEIELLDVIRKE